MLAVNISICVFVSMLDLSDWGCLSGVLHECLWSVWGFDLGEFWWECVSLDVFVSGFLCDCWCLGWSLCSVWEGAFFSCQLRACLGVGEGEGCVCVCVCVCVKAGSGPADCTGCEITEFLWAGKFFAPESALWPPATQRSLFPFRESIAHSPPEYLQTK